MNTMNTVMKEVTYVPPKNFTFPNDATAVMRAVAYVEYRKNLSTALKVKKGWNPALLGDINLFKLECPSPVLQQEDRYWLGLKQPSRTRIENAYTAKKWT